MSDSVDTINAQEVAEYLSNNLDFFQQHPEVLGQLEIPHGDGTAISLVERQVALLREQNIDLRNRFADLVTAAKENDHLFEKTKKFSLSLLASETLAATVETLDKLLSAEFKSDCFSLILWDFEFSVAHPRAILTSKSQALEAIPSFINLNAPVCGNLSKEESGFIFPHQAELIGSAAVIPLNHKSVQGLLCVGSYDEHRFSHKMGTIFIAYMGDLLARIIYQQCHIEIPKLTDSLSTN